MSELWSLLFGMNLAAAAAIVMVLAFRLPVRRLFGAHAAYALWLAVPLAAAAMLLPARVVSAPPPAPEPPPIAESMVFMSDADPAPVSDAMTVEDFATLLWALGAAASVALLVRRQRRFAQAAREGLAGPAVVGVIRPRIVAPRDFAERYTPPEQAVVMAHERTHIARHDSRINALVAAARCICWFNPMIHVGAHVLRIDQELSCDARVVAAHPKSRRAYAEAMLKTQLAARPLPLGCYWPAQSAHPLAERIRLLGRPRPGRAQRVAGMAFVVATGMFAAVSAWAARPPEFVSMDPVKVVARTPAPAIPTPRTASARASTRAAERTTPRAVEAPAAAPLVVATAPAAEAPAAAEPGPEVKRYVVVAPPPQPPPEVVLTTPADYPAESEIGASGAVQPGSAVQLITMVDVPDGRRQVVSNMTSFGSQSDYRTGTYSTHGSRYGLRTRVVQRGDRAEVFVRLIEERAPSRTLGSGVAILRSGETDEIVLSNGFPVTVSLLIRPETAYERERGERATARARATAAARTARLIRANLQRCRNDAPGC